MLVHHRHRLLGHGGAVFGRTEGLGPQHPLHPETQERQRIVDGFTQCRRVGEAEFARVFPLRKPSHAYLQLVLLFPLVEAGCRTLAGRVGVERKHHIARIALHQPHVFFSEGRTARGHRTADARAMETDDIGIALAHDDLIGVDDVALGPVEPVERARFGVDRRLRRVLVLRRVGGTGQDAPAQRRRLTVLGEDGKHHPRPERVLYTPRLVGEPQPGFAQQFGLHTQTATELIPVVGSPAQLELPRHIAGQPTRPQVVASLTCVGVREQALVVPLDRSVHGIDQLFATLPVAALAARGVAQL